MFKVVIFLKASPKPMAAGQYHFEAGEYERLLQDLKSYHATYEPKVEAYDCWSGALDEDLRRPTKVTVVFENVAMLG